ncbi:MAG: hypothetical protein WA738_00285 [Candidatus Angelobacter sp.]
MNERGLNLLVFREGRRHVSGSGLKLALMTRLEKPNSFSSRDDFADALLRAGELECGLADANNIATLSVAELTRCLAEALLRGQLPDNFSSIKKDFETGISVPEWVTLSTPEGFAYYALHPLAYADAVRMLPALPRNVVIVGIRSIGATLSAVTAAAIALRGAQVQRITVRPTGHPYNRRTEFSAQQLTLIKSSAPVDSAFLIVDEGPGLSGSSLLSVAEALEKAGVARKKIILLCGHEPKAEALCSDNAAERWRRYQCLPAAGEPHRPAGAGIFIGGGQWRIRLFDRESEWPGAWTSMERLKYLSSEEAGPRLFKFAGLGHYGQCILEREERVAAAGFGPTPRQESDGFVSYPWIEGRTMSASDLSQNALVRLAEYCAFRAQTFSASDVDISVLQEMAQHNLSELGFDSMTNLKLERPAIADGRMQPHEWLLAPSGQMLKTDSGGHGDDHFFPGPTDIAWDLAGAIVEWRMSEEHAKAMLDHYCRASGDDASERIAGFIKAYTVFRLSYCLMAANGMAGSDEQPRLQRTAESYRTLLTQIKTHSLAAASSLP